MHRGGKRDSGDAADEEVNHERRQRVGGEGRRGPSNERLKVEQVVVQEQPTAHDAQHHEQRLAADEIPFLELANPAQVGFENRGLLVEFVTIEGEACLEAQRVSCAESGGHETQRFSGLEQAIPDSL